MKMRTKNKSSILKCTTLLRMIEVPVLVTGASFIEVDEKIKYVRNKDFFNPFLNARRV